MVGTSPFIARGVVRSLVEELKSHVPHCQKPKQNTEAIMQHIQQRIKKNNSI